MVWHCYFEETGGEIAGDFNLFPILHIGDIWSMHNSTQTPLRQDVINITRNTVYQP